MCMVPTKNIAQVKEDFMKMLIIGGEASDSYQVIINRYCTEILDIVLTGEE